MKNKFTGVAILLFIFLFSNCSGELSSQDAVVLSPESRDLGILETKHKLNIEFQIVNDSDEKRKIISHAQSCGCTKMKMLTKTIEPHKKLKIQLTFDPKNESGHFEKSAFIRLDNNEILIFKFHGKIHS
jgi:Protein of unknown function (DUF1573)